MKYNKSTALIFLFPSILFIGGVLFIWGPFRSDHLDPEEKRGKQIFFEGTSNAGGKINAYIGASQVELPGSAATCASCHGADGRGRPEAGVIPSNITWDHLMKRYGHIHPNGRKHPAFTEATLKRCILTGYDPGGNRLETSMPTYSMTAGDINALVAYMKRLQADLDPGITETGIRIGTIVPETGSMGMIGQGMLEVMAAYFEDVNSRGGIFNRKIELVISRFDNTKQNALSTVARMVDEQDVFAMVAAVITGADVEIPQLVENKKIPLVGPLTLFSPDPIAVSEFTFYLYSGLMEQARALVEFAAQQLKLDKPRIALLGPDNDRDRAIKASIQEQCKINGWTTVTAVTTSGTVFDAAVVARKLKEERTDVLFYLGYGGLKVLLMEAEKVGWRPYVLMPGPNVREEILSVPRAFQNKIYLSYPTLPLDQTPEGISEFQALAEKHGLSVKHWTSQISAFVAGKTLVEGLKGAGRDLSRERFIRSLEKLYQFETGLTPPITFGPNRRIGALGAHIVTIDLEKKRFAPVGNWIPISEM